MRGSSDKSFLLSVTPNAFQRLMLQWERLAPYNAAQYATIACDFEDDQAGQAWRDTSIALGLQQIGQSPDGPVLFGTESIGSFITAELNRPSVAGESPLRPFIVRDADRVELGIFYRHVVADSASIRHIARAWIERLTKPAFPARDSHISLLRSPALNLFDSRRRWQLAREAVADLSRLSRIKRVRRLPATADPTSAVVWRRFEMPAGLLPRLVISTRRQRVRVNDLFVAAAAMACHDRVPHEQVDARADIGIGTIADVRPADRPPDRYFGVMLGFLQTFWRWQDLQSWPRMLARAAEQSNLARDRSLADASVIRQLIAMHSGDRMNARELANFYRKRSPLVAGISNVNLNRGWPADLFPSPIRSYTRVSPLGPILPLVFTPTTLGDSLHMGVTHRSSVLSTRDVEAIVRAFINVLEAAC